MNLQGLENYVLSYLQEPGSNYAGAPTWGNLTNPSFDQGTIDFFINRGYERFLADTQDFELVVVAASWLSTASTSTYAVPPVLSFATTASTAVSAIGSATVTPASMTGIIVNAPLNYDAAPNFESVIVTATTATTFTATFTKTHLTGVAIAAGVYPQIAQANHLFYQPKGLLYTRELEPATEFVSWAQFQRVTGQGYLRPYSFGTQPRYASVDPTRNNVVFYPGSSVAGDTITLEYCPLPTAGAPHCPPLVNETDVPLAPADSHEAIAQWALSNLWMKAREPSIARQCRQFYDNEVQRARALYQQRHQGDYLTIRPFNDRFSMGSW